MDELEILISNAQAGHLDAREQIIKQFRPLVIKVATSLSGRYVDKSSDEISIGMVAINQAIDSYSPQGGAAFLSYAELIIRRRLIDYYRSEKRGKKTIPFSSLGGESQEEGTSGLESIELGLALKEFQKVQEQEERREEIRAYAAKLREFGISFKELVNNSPKHEDARIRAMQVAKVLVAKEELRLYLKEKKALPLKLIEEQVPVSRKTLERQRKYIIAITLILTGDYRYLQEYISKALPKGGEGK